MKYILILLITLLFSCHKEEIVVNDPNSILNTDGWIIISYFSNGTYHNGEYSFYGFQFIDNTEPNCADYMKGQASCGYFSGYYEITNKEDKMLFNIILPNNCKLDKINGEWIISSINDRKIHLIRVGDNQELIFKR